MFHQPLEEISTKSFKFTEAKYEDEIMPAIEENYPDYASVIDRIKGVYDWSVLVEILDGEDYLSFAKVKAYEKHGKNLHILKNVMKKYYRFKFMKKSDEVLYDNISDNINLEKSVMEKFDTELVWNYLKKKGGNVSKIMYLYYYEDFTIKQIADTLNLTESNVKNYIYRTLKELRRISND